jgi:hypothetical protein
MLGKIDIVSVYGRHSSPRAQVNKIVGPRAPTGFRDFATVPEGRANGNAGFIPVLI